MSKIILPKICEKTGKPRISYSQVGSWNDYRPDYIKQYFAGIKLESGCYADFGTKVGTARETGDYSEFTLDEQKVLESVPRIKNCVYEREINLDFGDFILLGYIDEFIDNEEVNDNKTGGKGKQSLYRSEDYIQTVLYKKALIDEGYEIKKTGVNFFERGGSHFKPPLKLTGHYEYIPIEYSEDRWKYAEAKVRKAVSEISDSYRIYKKYF